MLGGSQRPNWPFLPGPTRRKRAQALLFNFNLKSSLVVRRERKFLCTDCSLAAKIFSRLFHGWEAMA